MNNNDQNTEYELLHIQSWEIEGCEEFTEEFYTTNTKLDQPIDLFGECNN